MVISLSRLFRKLFYWELEAMFFFRKRISARGEAKGEDNSDFRIVPMGNDLNDKQFRQLVEFYRISNQAEFTESKLRVLLRDEVCFTAYHDEEIVGVVWLQAEPGEHAGLYWSLIEKMEKGALITKAYVLEQFRGKRLQVRIQNRIKDSLANTDQVYVYSYVGVKNFASIINSLRANDEVRLIYCLHVESFGFGWNFFPKFRDEDWADQI